MKSLLRKLRVILLIGPAGVGKGTQGEALTPLGYEYIETGAVFRKMKKEGLLHADAVALMDKGGLLPDEMVFEIFCQNFGRVSKSAQKTILDGFPRKLRQAEALVRYLDSLEMPIELITVYLESDVATCVRNIKLRVAKMVARGLKPRDEDVDPVAREKRANEQLANCQEMKSFLKENSDHYFEIDARAEIEQVTLGIRTFLGSCVEAVEV